MSADVGSAARKHTWSLALPGAGWVWLPERDLSSVDQTEDGPSVQPWAVEAAVELAGHGPHAARLAVELALFSAADQRVARDAAALYVPHPPRGVLATLLVDRVRLDPARELPAGPPAGEPDDHDVAAALVGDLDVELGLAAPVVTRVELPAGPALRTQRIERLDAEHGFVLTESVTFLIAPPPTAMDGQPSTGLETQLQWRQLHRSEQLGALADEVAALVRTVPATRHG